MVDGGVWLNGPGDGLLFGECVGTNQNFIVASGRIPFAVYVYEAYSPYNLVARLPFHGRVFAVVISDDNTIAVSYPDSSSYWLAIYNYDGSTSWHMAKRFKLENIGKSLALFGNTLAVGVPFAENASGLVRVYNLVNGEWVESQTIRENGAKHFGWSIAMHGQHLAANSMFAVIFTYNFDAHKNIWVSNGKLTPPKVKKSSISMHKDILVATVNDNLDLPGVCGVAYKLSKISRGTTIDNKKINNDNNNNNDDDDNNDKNDNNNISDVWKEFATLTTKNDPLKSRYQEHHAVSVDGNEIYITRLDESSGGVGKVFQYDLSNL